jgi:hypothetical protein
MATALEHHEKVSFRLTKDKAIVFHALLNNINTNHNVQLEHPAEQKVLWDLECILQRIVSDIKAEEYEQRLKLAREHTWPKMQ